LIASLAAIADEHEISEIKRLAALQLPPITSHNALAAMIGINPGLVWSIDRKTEKYYRSFLLKKGTKTRIVYAPRIALKIIQKWLSFHFSKHYSPKSHVFGFINGRSHLNAAKIHCQARWVYSVDIENFFSTTPRSLIDRALLGLGYSTKSSELISRICCLRDHLVQGSPASPILSNLVFQEMDQRLEDIARKLDIRLTRYADDIVFSGLGRLPEALSKEIEYAFLNQVWRISEDKTEVSITPQRLKVHGLLVHGESVRLSKGYRNRIRAFKYLSARSRISKEDERRINGHLNFSRQVDSMKKS
jgi:RNA-directed DNA polymerase